MTKIALLDADVICYKAACVATRHIVWDEEVSSVSYDMERARAAVSHLADAWAEAAGCDERVLLFSDRTHPRASFRYQVHPHYKAQRKSSEKPACLEEVEAWALDVFDGEYWPGLEGDDALGLMTTGDPGRYVVVSTDKDMLTIPGQVLIVPHMRPASEGRVLGVSPDQADRAWLTQTMTGDVVDNYLGAPGFGPRRAIKALVEHPEDWWGGVMSAYEKAWSKEHWRKKFVTGSPREEALMNARCARILRDGDYKAGAVRLWAPDEGESEWLTTSCPS